MKSIRVLVVDDSPFVCRLLTAWLESSPGIQVVASARDGAQALELSAALKPDVITLDLEMPGMKGLQTLERLMQQSLTPVIVISGVSRKSAAMTLEALEQGAVDFILKYTPGLATDPDRLRHEIIAKVMMAASAGKHPAPRPTIKPAIREQKLLRALRLNQASATPQPVPSEGVVVIGAATGGPVALRQLIAELPDDFPSALLIIQHLPPTFTGIFAEQLNHQVSLNVREAQDGETLRAGVALIAPGGCHLRLEAEGKIRLEEGPEFSGYRPSIDLAMQSAAEAWQSQARGVLLTGMGQDGALGLGAIRSCGGRTFAQEPESCTISGMPQHAIEQGIVDHIASPRNIAHLLMAG
jgi:two-component system chemotaxis response regulator CheB